MRFLILALIGLATSALADPSALNKQITSAFPAAKWEDAMLSGNGLTGVMQYGGQPNETFILCSHKFIRPGKGRDPIPDMSDMVAPMRKLMLDGKVGEGWKLYYDEWEKRAGKGMIWTQQFHPGYQMNIKFVGGGYPIAYERQTNYETGEVIVRFTDGHGDWVRHTFVSRADDVVVTRLSASSKGQGINANVTMAECERHPREIKIEKLSDTTFLNWRARYPERRGDKGGYEGVTRTVLPKGGRTRSNKGRHFITGAPEIVLITALDRYRTEVDENFAAKKLQEKLTALPTSYNELLERHLAIHKPLFNRVEFSLHQDDDARSKSTEQLLHAEVADKENIHLPLLERLFYTSRYLFMASSGDDYAPRLTGLFIGKWGAAWAGDYTLDANANMAVMGGYIGNLAECMKGYHAIIERTLPQWRHGAKQLYGMRGVLGPVRIDGEVAVPHHMSLYHAHMTTTGLGPWILYPLWEYYETTGDKAFLKEKLYPLMKEQLAFYEDFLTERDENGKVIFVPSNSPENAWRGIKPRTSAAINSTMDISACRQLLTNLLTAEEHLGLEKSQTAQDLLSALPPYRVNKDGALQEWSWPGWGEYYPHRHSSHMYTVWPGYNINPDNPETKELVPTVVRALEKRDHSIIQAHDFIQRAIGWLRVKRPEPFFKILKFTVENNYLYSSLATAHNVNHDIYNFDYILTLQGLFIETAVFSRPGELEILPAMPKALKKGTFTGLKGRNQCTINRLDWDLEKGTAVVTLTSDIAQKLRLVLRPGIKEMKSDILTEPLPGDHEVLLDLPAQKETTIHLWFEPK